MQCHVMSDEKSATSKSCLSTIVSTNSTLTAKLFNFSNAGNNFSGKFKKCRCIFVEFF
jgi:hypothetical protein